MVISYRVVSWGDGVVAHVILVSAQVLWVFTLDFGLQTRAWQGLKASIRLNTVVFNLI